MLGWLGFASTQSEGRPVAAPQPVDSLSVSDQSDWRDELNEVMIKVVPWLVSLGLHLIIVIAAVLAVWYVKTNVDEQKKIIPDIRLGQTPGAPLMVNQESQEQKQSSARRTQTRQVRRTESVIDSQSKILESQIGVQGGPEATASPFGAGAEVGEGFSVGLFGNGGNARSIVFVIDASGSLFDTMPFVIDELKRTIGQLSAAQTFTVVFFQDGRVKEAPMTRGMKYADQKTKNQVIAWISSDEVTPVGRTDPTDAIKLALARKPDLVFLLSDNIIGSGRFGVDPDSLVQLIQTFNQGAKINTIQFVYPDPVTEFGREPTLKRISDATGGRYKFVSENDLNVR